MKNHSIKVPRLYKVAAQVAKEVSEGIGSIKSLVYEKQKKHPNIKAIYALVTTLFQKSEEIETLLKRSQLLVKETRFDPWLAKILIVELLWGKKNLPGQSKPENTVRAYEQIFKAHLSDTSTNETNFKENNKPRYVRVNTLLANFNEAVEGFRDDGWTLNKFFDKKDYKGYLEKVSSLNNEEFLIDIHVPNLLVFPPGTEFYRHPAYKNGSIILQDKASCLPVHILGPPPGSTVLDMCAAPGMKTTHLAAVLNNEGTVYAVERNPKRFEILNKIVSTSGSKCIKTLNKDVLECTKTDFPDVEYILVDPSCSGTGMTDRPQENEINASRLSNLTGFQIKILRHALTKFPNAKKVVYSTCSILPEENEDVVRQVLETNYNFKLISASQFVEETWHSFGSSDYGDIGKYCLYAKPNEDYTNGFFVAVFERLKEGEENPFFNTRIFNFKKHVEANEKWKIKKEKRYKEMFEENEITNENTKKKRKNHTVDNNRFQHNEDDKEINTFSTYNDDSFNKIDKDENRIDQEQSNKKRKKNKNIPNNEVIQIHEDTTRETFAENENISENKHKHKKKSKEKDQIDENKIEHILDNDAQTDETKSLKKKRKKKKHLEELEGNEEVRKNNKRKCKEQNEIDSVKETKEYKMRESINIEEIEQIENIDEPVTKKKKKSKVALSELIEDIAETNDINIEQKKKKKHKKTKESSEDVTLIEDLDIQKSKKKEKD